MLRSVSSMKSWRNKRQTDVDSRVRELLLGYVLGALDQHEVVAAEELLLLRPELHDELDRLRELLDPLDDIPNDEEPPANLAERTCNLVEFHARREDESLPLEPTTQSPARSIVLTGEGSPWSSMDMFVAIGICLTLAFLFFPALAASRDQARTMQCQNQLSHLGLALNMYYDRFGTYPAIPADGDLSFAGIFASSLRQTGLLEDDTDLLCPASPMAESFERWSGVHTVEEYSDPNSKVNLTELRQSGGSYAYCLGVFDDGQYGTPEQNDRPTFALLGDGSWTNRDGRYGHGKNGQNLLYLDGSVRWVHTVGLDYLPDHPYRNLRGQVSAGLTPDDAVLGDSTMAPFSILSVERNRQ
jgi:hypothetical protein